MGIKVKNYKGLDIYVTEDGMFYSNIDNNPDHKKANYTSFDMPSILESIDSINTRNFINTFIEIDPWAKSIRKVKTTGIFENIMIFFKDGNKRHKMTIDDLYSVDVENDPKYKLAKQLVKEVSEIREKIIVLRQDLYLKVDNFKTLLIDFEKYKQKFLI